MTSRRSLFLYAASLALAVPAAASPAEAEKRLRTAVDEVLGVADRASDSATLSTRVRPVLERHVNFETMTRRAVGFGWRQFSPEQQRQAVKLFTTVVIRSYTDKFTPGEHPRITWQPPVSPANGRVDVPTRMTYAGSNYQVTYRLENEGGWRITDVVIEGVSLVANYRSQLDASFKKGGAAAVIQSLEQSISRRP
jgi:phospholipid transport system substrate-binding protein